MDFSIENNLTNPYISIFFKVTSFIKLIVSRLKFLDIIHLIKTIIGIMQECAGFIIIKDTQSTYWEYAKMFSQ
jgi:hypothetical protein